jgi:dolichyl-phosphate beta-glucosyltransferase
LAAPLNLHGLYAIILPLFPFRSFHLKSEPGQDVFLTIIFPAFNEEDRLPASLIETAAYLCTCDYTWEIIVVDDGSSDGTVDAASEVLQRANASGRIIKLERNRGKGAAVNAGFRAANGHIVFFSDADLSTPIEELGRMLPMFDQGYDIVIGSRALPNSKVERHQPFYRENAGRIFNVFVQWLVFPGIKDTQCGFKGFRAAAIAPLLDMQTIDGFAFDVELLLLARKAGLKIAEAPVRWLNDEASKVGLLSDSLRMFLDLLRIRWRHRGRRAAVKPES